MFSPRVELLLAAAILASALAATHRSPLAVVGDAGTQSLDGSTEWSASNENGTVTVSAPVPGQVHGALMRAGVIGDPFQGLVAYDDIWVAQDNWTYSRKFELDREAVGGRRQWLVFEGWVMELKRGETERRERVRRREERSGEEQRECRERERERERENTGGIVEIERV